MTSRWIDGNQYLVLQSGNLELVPPYAGFAWLDAMWPVPRPITTSSTPLWNYDDEQGLIRAEQWSEHQSECAGPGCGCDFTDEAYEHFQPKHYLPESRS
jgi:hypothetical protein